MFIKALFIGPKAPGRLHDRCAARLRRLPAVLVWSAVCVAFCQGSLALTVEEEDSTSLSRFERTVASLKNGSTEQSLAFATIALARLADAYASEARLAREQARGSEGSASLRGWSVAVDGYARQMSLLLDDIERGYPVRLVQGGGSSPAVAVADRVVILSHPRPRQQSAFEQEILQEFCAGYRCDFTALEERDPDPIPVYTGHVRPAWSFTQDGPSCSYSGITVQFRSERNLANSRAICEQLMREAELLADEMAWQYRHAVSIDWRGLSIDATPGGPEHMVRLNGAGDVLLVSVPLLFSTPGLLPEIVLWVRQRLDGGQDVAIELDADSFGWQDP